MTIRGWTPVKNNPVNTPQAKRKLTPTHASKINALAQKGAASKLSFAVKVS